MKLDVIENKIIRTGRFKEQKFGIGNMAVLLEILRSRIYSNSIKAIAQEIMSNGRDAHREVGKQNIPIEVKIPNYLDPEFYVRDFGPGITPDRMANIFILYGASTKTDDNIQTGGFGLGAKTPFAYTDTFSVTSITPEEFYVDDKGEEHQNVVVRREYVAFIDETRIGSMTLVTSVITDEPQGTKVSLISKNEDFENFSRWVRHTAMYWQTVPGEPLPIIRGSSNWDWNIPKRETEGENWFLEGAKDYYTKDLNIIIDGIQYPVNIQNLNLGYNSPEQKLLHYSIRLIFDVGEISITANREEIDYTKGTTTNIIKSRLKLIIAELRDKLQEKVSSTPTYWEAKCLWKQYSTEYNGIVDSVEWNGIEINTSDIFVKDQLPTFIFTKRDDGYLLRKETNVIEFKSGTIVCIEDTGLKYPSKCRVQTLFDRSPNLTRVYVYRFPDDPKQKDIVEKKFNETYHLDKIDTIRLSIVPKTIVKVVSIAGGTRRAISRVFIFNPTNGGWRKNAWHETDLDIEEDSGIYVEIKNKKTIVNNNEVDILYFSDLVRVLGNKDIYGIPTRFLGKVGLNWQRIEELITNKVAETNKYLEQNDYNYGDEDFMFSKQFNSINFLLKFEKIKNKLNADSDFLKYVVASDEFVKIKEKVSDLSILRRYASVPEKKISTKASATVMTLKTMYKNITLKYPLLKYCNNWSGSDASTEVYCDYINMIDEK